MEILFDHNISKKLRRHFAPHQVTLIKDLGWEVLENGELLNAAQEEFDLLVTTDSNLYHQNKVADYNIAVVVLRAYRNSYDALVGLVPETLQVLKSIRPGEVVYVYADEKLKQGDRRKGKGRF